MFLYNKAPFCRNDEEKGRIGFVDLAKGFCIILVLLHHLESGIDIHFAIDPYLRTFRMPLYFLLSGLFFKTYNNFLNFVIKKANKLLIPFLFFFLFTSVFFTWFFQLLKNEVINWNLLLSFITKEECVNNRPIWFLWCLFLLNLIFYLVYIISGVVHKYQIPFLFIFSLLLGTCGYFFGLYGINIPAFVDSSLTAIPFFSLGFLLRKYTSLLFPNLWDRYNFLFVLFCIVIVYCLSNGEVNYRTNRYSMSLIHVYITGILGSLGIIYISKIIHWLPIISYLGRYSIMVLVTHKILMIPFIWIILKINLSKICSFYLIASLMILSYLIIIPIMKKFLPHVTAQKDVIKIKNT